MGLLDRPEHVVQVVVVAFSVGYRALGIPTSHALILPAKSEASGRYTIRGVPEASVVVNARSVQHLADYQHIQSRAGDCSRVDFHLQKALLLSFLVKNNRGEMLSKPWGRCKGQDPETVTFYVEQGILRLGINSRPGPFECTIGAEGYEPMTVVVDANAPPREIILDALAPREIKGCVMTELGEPLPATRIQIGKWNIETDSDGKFSKSVTTSDRTIPVHINKSGYLEYFETVPLNNQPLAKEIEIRLKQSEGGLFGRVIDDAGRAVQRFEIVFRGSPKAEPERSIYIRGFEGEEGLFSVSDIPAGIYDLYVEAIPYGPMDDMLLQNMELKNVEIRKGYFLGELLFQFPPRKEVRK
jgi:hypothetical protein